MVSDGVTYGYARVSTDDQDLTLQREALIRYGVDPKWIYEEHASGKSMERPQLLRCLRSMRDEDTLVVWKLDRLGRNLKGVLEMLERIEALEARETLDADEIRRCLDPEAKVAVIAPQVAACP